MGRHPWRRAKVTFRGGLRCTVGRAEVLHGRVGWVAGVSKGVEVRASKGMHVACMARVTKATRVVAATVTPGVP